VTSNLPAGAELGLADAPAAADRGRASAIAAQRFALLLAEHESGVRRLNGLDSYLGLLGRLAQGAPVDAARSHLVDQALTMWARPGFDTFVSTSRLRFEPFDYQLRAAELVLRRMRGRAILADEVGLGKTIEAALVASELRLRGLASRVLVLAPAGLVEQWREELDRKFALPSVLAVTGWEPAAQAGERPFVLASLAAARRAPLRDTLVETDWDLVIADEAHRLKNPRSASAKLVRALRTRYLLLLTATPVENRLDDLFQLVNLVKPGHLGTPREFRTRHSAIPGGSAPARDLPLLQLRMREVMVRHRRSELAAMLPRRLAETLVIRPDGEEAALYGLVSDRVRSEALHAPPTRKLALRGVQRLAGSSPQALAPGLAKLGWSDLAHRAAEVERTEKARALVELVRRHVVGGNKVVVFTAFRKTLEFLTGQLAIGGVPTAVYHGSLPRRDKEAAIGAFREDVPVLVTTEAAGEGRNLQFCHVMVNYDLPWNPMQIEQRLGRIHRIGQEREVLVTNLVTSDTVEALVLRVLEAKINLFELVIGELDMILGRIEEDFDFERFVFEAHIASRDDGELAARLEALGDDLSNARRQQLDSRGGIDALVAEGR
jgi:SNF2 family DNA or RNA helicase